MYQRSERSGTAKEACEDCATKDHQGHMQEGAHQLRLHHGKHAAKTDAEPANDQEQDGDKVIFHVGCKVAIAVAKILGYTRAR